MALCTSTIMHQLFCVAKVESRKNSYLIENSLSDQLSRLEVLAEKTFTHFLMNGPEKEKDVKIMSFLAEESIIERARSCQKYFTEHVTPIGAAQQVSRKPRGCFCR